MPSPVEDRPGLLIRDSFQYSDAILVIPPVLVPALTCFDGVQTELDLREMLARVTGQLDVSGVARHLHSVLHASGFLEDENFERRKEERERAFAGSPVREPAHAGTAYPADSDELRTVMANYLAGDSEPPDRVPVAIAAPHVSPEGGWECYRAAYARLPAEARDRTFVILGTSHYGAPDRFGLTRKPFVTPFGTTRTAPDLLDRLAVQPAALMEDYCHAVEHSIEFQVVFLQSIFGPEIRVLPILCGSFGPSIYEGGLPEKNEDVARFLDGLGELHAKEQERLLWVLGIDMAHMGRRYGDRFAAIANQDGMAAVADRDHARIHRVNSADPRGFWDLVQQNRDDLKWCGSSPLYTFLKAVPGIRGTLRKYEQWNIDKESIVSFAGITFA
ncbi:MAG: AmmeMemoRadiSam system protein B [Acidobacteriota bacterium]|nr:AmmeMemoRadiSam system protein B [Acidobacteriota bacterium]